MTPMSQTQLANCPLCHRQLSLPEDLDGEDIVRCPLCRREFAAKNLIPVVPQVEVVRKERRTNVSGPSAQPAHGGITPATARTTTNGGGEPGDGIRQPAPVNSAGTLATELVRPPIEVRQSTTEVAEDEKAAIVRKRYFSHDQLKAKRATTAKGKRHSRRSKKFSAGEALKIVLGGLLAFPIAQAILWWGLGRDPFHLGKPVSRVVRYVVPPQFRENLVDDSLPTEQGPISKTAESILNAKSPFDFSGPDLNPK